MFPRTLALFLLADAGWLMWQGHDTRQPLLWLVGILVALPGVAMLIPAVRRLR